MEFSLPLPLQNEILGRFSNKWHDFMNHFNGHQHGHSKTSVLLHYGAQTLKEFQLANKISAEEFPRFSAFLETLEIQCLFQIVLCFIRRLFFTHCRRPGSTMQEFYIELRLLSDLCSFDDNDHDNIVRNQLIGNVQDKSARDVLVSVNSLTAKNVVDVCSIAERQGTIVNIDILNMFIMSHQQKSFLNTENKAKKEYGWSSFQEPQTNIIDNNDSLNFGSLFRSASQSQIPNKMEKNGRPDFSAKQNSYDGFNFPIPDPVSDSSFYSVKTTSMEDTYHQSDEAVTHFVSQITHTTSFAAPFAESHQSDFKPVVMQVTEGANTEISSRTKISDDANTNLMSSNNNSITNDLLNDEAHDDLLMSILDPNTGSSREEKDPKSSANSVVAKGDSFEVPAVFISQQKAILKTSQVMTKATGQAVDLYSCNFCIFSCAGKVAIEEHAMQVHNSLKCFVCTSCNAKFSSKEPLESHIRVKHLNVEEHKCQICDLVFVSQNKLFLHLQGHAEARTVSCRVCCAMFNTEGMLSEHMLSAHPDTDRWVCRICSETFTVRRLLSDHVSNVHKDREERIVRRFMCKLCDITFTDKKSSQMHKRKFHRKSHVKRFSCSQCDHICSSNANLISHMRIHTGEKPFVCEVCGKEFSQSSSLDKHARTHTGEKPYKCQYCGLSFNTSSNRLVHERNHRKERPYVCEQCGKTFRNSYELKVHIDTHNEFRTKRFVCHCGAAFDTKRKLTRHEVCHSGQKPYKCEICGAGFTRSENVKGHQKSQACRNRVLKRQ